MRSDGALEIVNVADVGEEALLVHDPTALTPGSRSRWPNFQDPTGPTPIGVFRDVERPVYGRTARRTPPGPQTWS